MSHACDFAFKKVMSEANNIIAFAFGVKGYPFTRSNIGICVSLLLLNSY